MEYAAFAVIQITFPVAYYFVARKDWIDTFTANNFYKWAWMTIWIGNLLLFGFPAIGAAISFAAIP